MAIGEVKNMFKDQYADVEYYRNIFNCTHQIDFNLEHCTVWMLVRSMTTWKQCHISLPTKIHIIKQYLQTVKSLPTLRIGMETILRKCSVF